jgi:hypothetical protein
MGERKFNVRSTGPTSSKLIITLVADPLVPHIGCAIVASARVGSKQKRPSTLAALSVDFSDPDLDAEDAGFALTSSAVNPLLVNLPNRFMKSA